jgi:hypothetical protein
MTDTRPVRRSRHVARSARILSTGLSATAILGITAAFGAAEHARSTDQTNGDISSTDLASSSSSVAGEPSALAPLGTPALAAADPIRQYPSTEGTVILPSAASPTQGTVNAQSNQKASIPPDPSPTAPVWVAPVDTAVIDTAPATKLAPLTPAEPPTQLTLPPAPSRGSSGGSR